MIHFSAQLTICVWQTRILIGDEIKDKNLKQLNKGVSAKLTKIDEIRIADEHLINLPANYKDRITTKWLTKLSLRENNHWTDNTFY